MPRNNTTTAILLLLTATTASSFVPSIDDLSSRTAAAFHAITEDFQRSLLAAQFANNNNNNNSNQPGSPSPTKSIKSVQSVDYDAAARLAYESSNSNQDFTTYKQTYLQEKSTLIATKQRTRMAKEKAAEAKEKAKKAAEAAMIAKEKAQAKIREREEAAAAAAVVAAAEAYEDVLEKETGGDVVAPSEPVVETATAATITEVKEPTPPSTTKPSSSTTTTGSKSMAIVPINEATTQFTAGALGAAAGLLLGGGPFLAMFLSATANYLSRKEDDSSTAEDVASPKRIVDKVAQTALLIYNYVAQLERENQIVDGTFKAIGGAVGKAKQSPDSSTGETITAIESTLKGVTKNIEQLNDEFDLVGGAGTVLNSVGDLVEDSVDKVIDLNEQYQLVERVGGVVKGAVTKVSEKKE